MSKDIYIKIKHKWIMMYSDLLDLNFVIVVLLAIFAILTISIGIVVLYRRIVLCL
jgi:subtilase family serine protease